MKISLLVRCLVLTIVALTVMTARSEATPKVSHKSSSHSRKDWVPSFTPPTTVVGSHTYSPNLQRTTRVALNGAPSAGNVPANAGIAPANPAVAGPVSLIGSEELNGQSRLEFQFHPSTGQVVMIHARGATTGTYTNLDDKVLLSFHQGAVKYVATIYGDTIFGVASMGTTSWQFSVKSATFHFTQLRKPLP